MKKINFFIGLILICFQLQAQYDSLNVSVFFNSADYGLNQIEEEKIANKVKQLNINSVQTIQVIGHTDNIGSELYNLNLSKLRSESVFQYLSKYFDSSKLEIEFFGENNPLYLNSNEENRLFNRRVDIVFIYQKTEEKSKGLSIDSSFFLIEEKVDEELTETNIDTCLGGDTLIELSSGNLVKMDKCMFIDVQDCTQIIELTNSASLVENGVTTMTSDGEELMSCGMINVEIQDSCSIKCESLIFTVLYPVKKIDKCVNCPSGPEMYYINQDGETWDPADVQLPIVHIEKRSFYEMKFSSCVMQNCDCKAIGPKISIKGPKNIELWNFSITYQCPLARHNYWSDTLVRRNMVNGSVMCWNTPKYMYATGLHKNGDTMKVFKMPFDELRHGIKAVKCKERKMVKSGKDHNGKVIKYKIYLKKDDIPKRRTLFKKYQLKEGDFK